MSARKHRFTCGHLGFGQYCHRCAQADEFREKANAIPLKDRVKHRGRESYSYLKDQERQLRAVPSRSKSRADSIARSKL